MYKGFWGEIPVGQMGVQTDLPSSEIPHEALIKANSVTFTNGYVEKAPGAYSYNNNAFTGGLIACTDFWLDGITQRTLVATADGKIWKDYGDRTFLNNTPILTGLGTIDNRSMFVIGGAETASVINNPKKAFFFTNGVKQIQVVRGDNNVPSAIQLPATDWPNPTPTTNYSSYFPKFGLIHRSRLWVFMRSNAYGSNTTNHEDFQTGGSTLNITVGAGEGGDIIGAFVYKGSLLVFKQGDFLYQLIDTDTSTTNWYFKKLGDGMSMANARCNAQVIDDMLLASAPGNVTSLKATLNYGNYSQGDVFKQQLVSQFFRTYTSPIQSAPFMQSVFYPDKGQAFFTARSGMLPNNDVMIVYDVSRDQAPKFGLWSHYQADCIGLRRDINGIPRPMYGGTNGYLYFADWPTCAILTSSTTTGYTAEFKTPYLDFRWLDAVYNQELSEKQKQFDHLAVTFTPFGNNSLNVDVWIDGKFSETVTAAMTIDTNYLGSFTLGTSILGVEEEQTIIVPIHGTGRRISLRCYNSNAYESFRVSKLGIGFRPLSEDQTRIAAP